MNADQLKILCKGLEDAMTGLETMIQFSKTQADRIAELENEVNRLKQIIDANNLNQNIDQFIKQKPDASEPVETKTIYKITPEMIGAALGLKPRRRKKK